MDSSGLETLRQSVVASLESVSKSTERVYHKMGETYPRLIRELDAGFGQGGGNSAHLGLTTTIDDTLRTIEERDVLFKIGHEQDGKMLARLGGQLTELRKLSNHVEEIREDSVLMELISLNAMVVAAKAGESGRAFSCITTELKKLSNETMALTDHISLGEQNLDTVFVDFETNIKTSMGSEQEGFVSLIARIREVFEGLNSGARVLLEGLEEIRKRSDAVKSPLVVIMVEIQNQDRIRQSIDHVLLSMREFHTVDADAPVESQLDDLSFLEIIPELSWQVLDEIRGQILANRRQFQQSLDQAKELIDRLEQERRQFLDNHLNTRRDGSLEHWFQMGAQQFAAYVSQTSGMLRHRETTFRRSVTLQKNADQLVESLRSFDFLLSKFRSIDLASRIQVARQSALRAMKDNASEMTQLTEKIARDVGQSIEITAAFFVSVEEIFASYRDRFNAGQKSDELFNADLKETLEKLKASQQELSRSVLESQVFTGAFLEQFRHTETDLTTLDELLQEVDGRRADLQSLKAKVTEQKSAVMSAHGIVEWKLSSDKLKAMIDRFTIFTHKKIAAQLGDFEVEQSVDSGEVTLF